MKAEADQCSALLEGKHKTHGRFFNESMSRLDTESAEKQKFDRKFSDPKLELMRERDAKKWGRCPQSPTDIEGRAGGGET